MATLYFLLITKQKENMMDKEELIEFLKKHLDECEFEMIGDTVDTTCNDDCDICEFAERCKNFGINLK